MTVPAMTAVSVTIDGLTPLLCGKPAEPQADLTPRQQAMLRLYQDSMGKPIIPGINLFRCLIGAARLVNVPAADLRVGLSITGNEIPITSKQSWQVDTRMVRKPGSRERTTCHRPRFDSWSLSFEIQVDEELVPLDMVAALIATAGQRLGLGDFRAERGGPFGRFQISYWGHP